MHVMMSVWFAITVTKLPMASHEPTSSRRLSYSPVLNQATALNSQKTPRSCLLITCLHWSIPVCLDVDCMAQSCGGVVTIGGHDNCRTMTVARRQH